MMNIIISLVIIFAWLLVGFIAATCATIYDFCTCHYDSIDRYITDTCPLYAFIFAIILGPFTLLLIVGYGCWVLAGKFQIWYISKI